VAEEFTCAVENEEYRSACRDLPKYSGSRYCVLHEPDESKNKEAFEEAQKSKLAQKDYDFGGAVFPDGTSDFEGFEFDAATNFDGATFFGAANFTRVQFSGVQTSFDGAQFSGNATHFEGAQFSGIDTFFQDAQFRAEETHFEEVDFSSAQRTYFSGAQFSSARTHFSKAQFSSERTSFRGAQFSGERTHFSESKFSGERTYFEGTKFSGAWTDFLGAEFISKETHFEGAEFSGERTIFRRAQFRAEETHFEEVDFSGEGTDFSSAEFSSERTDFSEAQFRAEETGFINTTFLNRVFFTSANFRNRVTFWGPENAVFDANAEPRFLHVRIDNPALLTFYKVFLRPHWFHGLDVRKVDFTEVQWRGLPGGPSGTLDEEINALKKQDIKSPYGLLAQTCRRLSANAEENREYPLANEFYYWSMDTLRKEGWRRLGLISTMYWLLCGYGVRARRAFLVLLGIWAAFTLLYLLVPSSPFSEFSVSDFGEATVYSLGAIARLNPEPKPDPGWFQFLVTLEGLLGPLQIGLLLLAIRRKVMR
jgi:uncharacterized protein YjbI with pentapeptide repeats